MRDLIIRALYAGNGPSQICSVSRALRFKQQPQQQQQQQPQQPMKDSDLSVVLLLSL